jgi:predicted glycogen debranching enzyme
MNIKLQKQEINNLEQSTFLEWIETNGLGGWASGTISGINSRRYHGLLVAATEPPVGRMVMVSKIAETIFTENETVELDANNFNGHIHPKGFQFLESFEKDLFPVFRYKIGNLELTKTIFMVDSSNTTVIKYEIKGNNDPIKIKIKPFIAGKNYHWMSKANGHISTAYSFKDGIFKVKPYDFTPSLYIHTLEADFHYSPDWYYNYFYAIEQERVQEYNEDLFTYGEFFAYLTKEKPYYVVLSTERLNNFDPEIAFEKEKKRKQALLKSAEKEDFFLQTLLLAADQFIVKRGDNFKTIIAGYHWFADWGRDTMISLPGLCIETGRYDDAKKILSAFAQVVDQGMIPNRFADFGEVPEYNNADGTLWYFIALHYYLEKTKDYKFAQNELYQILIDILDWHYKGTRYGIKMDSDYLLKTGELGSQLTWMDAKVGDWVVTPRVGKPVEINALWYNVHKIMADISSKIGKKEKQIDFENKANLILKSFKKSFDIKGCDYLPDVFIDEQNIDWSIRPNQLFALSLPYPLITAAKAKKILKLTEEQLLTTKGLRSLSPKDQNYRPYYTGDQLSRDGAYHQGTVWSWLIGPYLIAKMEIEGKSSLKKAQKWFKEFEPHLREACIGQISEIFDATEPHYPKGCIAQAWGVAEVLRAYKKYLTLLKQD